MQTRLTLTHVLTIGALAFLFTVLGISCTKNPTPPPPVHDTTVVIKHDTTVRKDTVAYVDPAINSLKQGLVLYLPLNGSMADSSGKGNTVTPVNGAALTYDMHGYANSAFGGTGNGARLIVGNNGGYKIDTAFSISFDFEMNQPPGGTLQTLLSLVNVTTGNGPAFDLGFNNPADPSHFFLTTNTAQNNDCSLNGLDPTTVGNTPQIKTSFMPQANSWYNAICVFNNGSAWIYINGIAIDSQKRVAAPNLWCPDANFVVGGWWNGGPESINGKLDEIRLYNRVLTSHEIAYLNRNFQVNSTSAKPQLKKLP